MTRMDEVIAKLRALPENLQDDTAAEILYWFAAPGAQSELSSDQLAQVRRALAEEPPGMTPHHEVVARMRAKYGLNDGVPISE